MEERLKLLEGITQSEWRKIVLVVNNRFVEIKNQSILTIDENTLNELNAIM